MHHDQCDDEFACDCPTMEMHGSGLENAAFVGQRVMKGYNIFGRFFNWIAPKIMPLLKPIGSYIGRTLFSTGGDIVNDWAEGETIKESAKKRFKQAKEQVKSDAMNKLQRLLQGGSGRRRPRKCKRRTCKKINNGKKIVKRRRRTRKRSKKVADFLK